MTQEQAQEARPHYRAFVSYSHADTGFANWLHRRLEAWRPPEGERLAPIFIDRAELAAGPHLPAQVREALARSAALIVVASPAARASRWVGQEIALFRDLHPDRPVLAALIEGEPDESFPPALTEYRGRALEPLAADFRKRQDGKRLGYLKIAAGLSGLPLDRLVQRDTQQRQRRVMAVTAVAVVISMVLAGLLIAAVRARAEAERQRGEAEGMVEFMLTDLRDRLKGAGSLKAMSAVNHRALAYYSAQDLSALPNHSLTRRARVLLAMGEDDSKLGNLTASIGKYREAHRTTAAVLARHPADAEAIFAHAQSEFWVGEAASRQGDLAATEMHWRGYLKQAEALARIEPGTRRSLMEMGYALGNLCQLTMMHKRTVDQARPFCEKANARMRAALALDPDHAETALAYANRLGWLADLEVKAERPAQALALRSEEAAIVERLLRNEPDNSEYRERRIWPDIGIADALARQDRPGEALQILERCLSEYDRLAASRGDDTAITEARMRIASLAAMTARAKGLAEAGQWTARARAIHLQLKRTHTAEQMARYDKMLDKLEKGGNQ